MEFDCAWHIMIKGNSASTYFLIRIYLFIKIYPTLLESSLNSGTKSEIITALLSPEKWFKHSNNHVTINLDNLDQI